MHQLKWMSYDVEFSLFCFVESVCVSLIRYAHNRLADCSSLVFETDLKIIVCTSDSLKLQSWLVQWGLCFVGNRNRIYETHPLADQCRSYIHTGTSAHVHPHKLYLHIQSHTIRCQLNWLMCLCKTSRSNLLMHSAHGRLESFMILTFRVVAFVCLHPHSRRTHTEHHQFVEIDWKLVLQQQKHQQMKSLRRKDFRENAIHTHTF